MNTVASLRVSTLHQLQYTLPYPGQTTSILNTHLHDSFYPKHDLKAGKKREYNSLAFHEIPILQNTYAINGLNTHINTRD